MKRALLLALLLGSGSVFGYPISPATLWNLAADAELVVVARVEAVHDDTFSPMSFAQAAEWKADPTGRGGAELARLRVTQTLKGRPAEVLEVVTSRGIICPAPGRFLVGETVLAFLSSYAGHWHVEGRSYGTLYPEPDELPVVKERLAMAVALQTTGFTPAQKLDWAVGTAARRATRWQGAYELASALDSIHAYYDDRPRDPEVKLTRAQRQALADGFVREPSADTTTAMMAKLLEGHADPALDRAFVGAVDALLEEGDAWAASQAAGAVIARAGGDPKTLLPPRDETFAPPDLAALREAWAHARAKLRMPEGSRLLPRPPRPSGVGELTPP